ncbi:hypothetical protein [Burkholderia sp. Ac-20379]|nr:hypothetical protein [Burkholderia sp. Ac-20379]
MANRIFRVSIPDDLVSAFSFVAACINLAGLTIQNPETGKITSWSDDGEQIVTVSAEVLENIKSGNLRNVQFWSSPSSDMFVSWNGDARLSTFSLHLDGVAAIHCVAVASKLIEGLLSQYASKNLSGDAFAVNFE